MASGIYAGTVFHQRFRPKPHRLRYRMAQMLFDLDDIDSIATRCRLFARNRIAPLAFYDRDFGDRSGQNLREQVSGWLEQAGIADDGGPVRLLAMPRIFGFVFNPISTWFVHGQDGRLRATVYEVTNTFHDRHFYVTPTMPDDEGLVRQSCAKALHVSPFMDMDMHYDFVLTPPADRVALKVEGSDSEGKLIVASFAGRRSEFCDSTLLRLLVRFPLMTFFVVAAIHWQAAKLWMKGIAVRRRPAPPPFAVTSGRGDGGR